MINQIRVMLAVAVVALIGMLTGLVPMGLAWSMIVLVIVTMLLMAVIAAARTTK